MHELMNKQALTVDDIRTVLGIGQNSAYKLIHSNTFPVRKIGRTYRIPTKAFFTWLDHRDGHQDNAWDNKPTL